MNPSKPGRPRPPDSKHTWIGKVDLNVSVACMVHRLVLTVGGTGIGGLATRSWPRFPSR